MATLHLLHGPVGSGKTTFARQLERKIRAVRFTPDEWMIRLYGDRPPVETFQETLDRLYELISRTRAAETQAVVAGQYDYELTDMTTLQVLDVLLEGTDVAGENHIPLQFSPYFEDGRAFIRLASTAWLRQSHLPLYHSAYRQWIG